MTLTLTFDSPEALALGQVRRWLLDAERLAGGHRKTTGLPTLLALDPAAGTLTLGLSDALAADLATDLAHLLRGEGLDRLRPARAKTLHRWQQQARQPGGVQQVKIALAGQPTLVVDASTGYAFQELWVDVEVYLYGLVTKMGGRGQARIQIRDTTHGLRAVRCHKDVLAVEERNRLYRFCGLHARAKQNTLSGRTERYELIGFVDARAQLSRREAAQLFAATA